MGNGFQNLDQAWKEMGPRAKEEYGHLVEKFVKFNEKEPGIHPKFVAQAMLEAMLVDDPPLRYKVGFESKVSPIVGLLPTKMREWMLRKAMFEFE